MAFSMNTNKKSAMSEINVTPLVDVMLVLLIIFMVTAPMMQEGVAVDLPQAKGQPIPREQNQKEVVISVSGPGNIYMNDVPVKEDQLESRVLEAIKGSSAPDVFLRGDKGVPFGAVVRIMGVLTAAGIKNINIITSGEEKTSPTQ
jgi:biopolymer transport protein TolR